MTEKIWVTKLLETAAEQDTPAAILDTLTGALVPMAEAMVAETDKPKQRGQLILLRHEMHRLEERINTMLFALWCQLYDGVLDDYINDS